MYFSICYRIGDEIANEIRQSLKNAIERFKKDNRYHCRCYDNDTQSIIMTSEGWAKLFIIDNPLIIDYEGVTDSNDIYGIKCEWNPNCKIWEFSLKHNGHRHTTGGIFIDDKVSELNPIWKIIPKLDNSFTYNYKTNHPEFKPLGWFTSMLPKDWENVLGYNPTDPDTIVMMNNDKKTPIPVRMSQIQIPT